MSEPTIRLPLRVHHNVREDYNHAGILDASGEQTAVGDVVSLVNSQAERIRGLEEAMRLAVVTLDGDACDNILRAALDKAGKE